jgi:hypothetical protein
LKIYSADYLLTMSPNNEVITNGGMLIDGDTIVAFGQTNELIEARPSAALQPPVLACCDQLI